MKKFSDFFGERCTWVALSCSITVQLEALSPPNTTPHLLLGIHFLSGNRLIFGYLQHDFQFSECWDRQIPFLWLWQARDTGCLRVCLWTKPLTIMLFRWISIHGFDMLLWKVKLINKNVIHLPTDFPFCWQPDRDRALKWIEEFIAWKNWYLFIISGYHAKEIKWGLANLKWVIHVISVESEGLWYIVGPMQHACAYHAIGVSTVLMPCQSGTQEHSYVKDATHSLQWFGVWKRESLFVITVIGLAMEPQH